MSARMPIDLAARAALALDDADDAGPADAGHDLVAAECLELVGDDAGGAVHVEEELGVLVEIAAPAGDLVGKVGDAVDDGHGIGLVAGRGRSCAYPSPPRVASRRDSSALARGLRDARGWTGARVRV